MPNSHHRVSHVSSCGANSGRGIMAETSVQCWMPHRDAMAKSASVLEHDESEGRPSVEVVPDDLRAQIAAGQCVAIRGACGSARSE